MPKTDPTLRERAKKVATIFKIGSSVSRDYIWLTGLIEEALKDQLKADAEIAKGHCCSNGDILNCEDMIAQEILKQVEG